MRSFLFSKIAIPLHLAFIFGYLACVQPGPESITSYLPLAFFAAGLFEITLLFPSARKGEDVDDARYRVLRGIFSDPVFFFGVAAFIFIVFQTLNGPRDLIYDRILKCWRYTPGYFRGLPACLDMTLSFQGAFWVLVVAVSMLAVRSGLGKKGRNLLLKLMLGVASALALYGLFTYEPAEAGAPILPLATFATPSEAGAFFLMNACAAFGLLFTEMAMEEPGKNSLRFLLFALVANLMAALYSLSCLVIATLAVALVILTIYTLVFFVKEAAGELRLTTLAVTAILIAVVCFLHFVAYPKNRLHECADRIFNGPWQTEAQKAEAGVMRAAAWRMFNDNTLGGTGTWCYGHENGMSRYLKDDEWQHISDPDSRHYICGNDFAQFLAEYGALGFALMAAPFAMILISSIIRMFLVSRNGTKLRPGRKATTAAEIDRVNIFDILPLNVLALAIAAGSTTAISFFAPVFRCPLNILTWAVLLSLAHAQLAIPKKIQK